MNKTCDLRLSLCVRSDPFVEVGGFFSSVVEIDVCSSVWEHRDPFVGKKSSSLSPCLSSFIWARGIDWVSGEPLTSNLATVFYSPSGFNEARIYRYSSRRGCQATMRDLLQKAGLFIIYVREKMSFSKGEGRIYRYKHQRAIWKNENAASKWARQRRRDLTGETINAALSWFFWARHQTLWCHIVGVRDIFRRLFLRK